ncbi:MAG: L-threonylcarbamoyladenylate synthase [Planctomycetota bacterium]
METRVFRVDPCRFDPGELDEPAQIIAGGGLVAFPTETVYGIAADAHNPDAVHRLRQVKNRPADKPLSLHIADQEEVHRLVDKIPSPARVLMELYWPGPLTIIFPGNAGRGIGVRLPSHALAQELIRRSGVPVLAPSANVSGEAPGCDADQVLGAFQGKIEAIVDGGPVTIRQASTVVRVDETGFQVLREGIITAGMVTRALKGKRILIVCTGNSCRSPMAEALLRRLLAAHLGVSVEELAQKGYQVTSAGIAAFGGGNASRNAIEVMKERGIDLSGHRSRAVTRELTEDADLIIAMGPSHRWQLIQWHPEIVTKVHLIREEGIPDPIGGDIDAYEGCAADIEEALSRTWLQEVLEL